MIKVDSNLLDICKGSRAFSKLITLEGKINYVNSKLDILFRWPLRIRLVILKEVSNPES